jgi:hypothetical protein
MLRPLGWLLVLSMLRLWSRGCEGVGRVEGELDVREGGSYDTDLLSFDFLGEKIGYHAGYNRRLNSSFLDRSLFLAVSKVLI